MPDKYTTREDMEDADRRRNDPCYHGHNYIEYDRKESRGEEQGYWQDCKCTNTRDRDCSCNPLWIRTGYSISVTSYFRCSRCGRESTG